MPVSYAAYIPPLQRDMFGIWVGGLFWVVSRLGLPLGRLPGDFRFQAGGITCFLPLASSILLSLLLTLVLNLIARRLK